MPPANNSLDRFSFWRMLFVGILEMCLAVLVGGLFWLQVWQRSLPKSNPPELRQPVMETPVDFVISRNRPEFRRPSKGASWVSNNSCPAGEMRTASPG